MKNVLIVFNHPAPYKVRLFNELSKSLDLTVIFERTENKDRSKDFYSENKYDFKTVKISGLKLGNENIVSRGVRNHIKKNKYDLIVMNGYSQFAEMSAIRYMQKHKIPYALFINGGIINKDESNCKRKIKTKYISKAKFFLSPDQESNKYLVYYGADESKIYNYPYSTVYEKEISRPMTSEEKNKLREQLNLEGNKIYVSAGQLIKRKNYQSLIENWKEMPDDHHLYVFGDGKERKKYLKIVAENHLNNVHLQAFLPKSELFKVFNTADVFIFPSSEDIYGHVINEALSQGLPVISNTNVNSAKKLINDKTGVLTNDFTAKSILEYTKKVEKDCKAQDCINVAKENTVEKMSDSILKILEAN